MQEMEETPSAYQKEMHRLAVSQLKEAKRIRNNVVFFFWMFILFVFGWIFFILFLGGIAALATSGM